MRCPHHLRHQSRPAQIRDRKSTRLNSSHSQISYAVFCLKQKADHRLREHRVTSSGYEKGRRPAAALPMTHLRSAAGTESISVVHLLRSEPQPDTSWI